MVKGYHTMADIASQTIRYRQYINLLTNFFTRIDDKTYDAIVKRRDDILNDYRFLKSEYNKHIANETIKTVTGLAGRSVETAAKTVSSGMKVSAILKFTGNVVQIILIFMIPLVIIVLLIWGIGWSNRSVDDSSQSFGSYCRHKVRELGDIVDLRIVSRHKSKHPSVTRREIGSGAICDEDDYTLDPLSDKCVPKNGPSPIVWTIDDLDQTRMKADLGKPLVDILKKKKGSVITIPYVAVDGDPGTYVPNCLDAELKDSEGNIVDNVSIFNPDESTVTRCVPSIMNH